MPIIGNNDVSFVFSGGVQNSNPALSLGGTPSDIPIGNKLFDDISPDQAQNGDIQYRCIYLVNDSEEASLFDTKIFVVDQVAGGAYAQLGFNPINARQRVQIANADNISSGSFTLAYEGATETTNFTIDYPGLGESWESNLQDAIHTVPGLEDVTVSTSFYEGILILQVDFSGGARYKNHPNFIVISNNLNSSNASFPIDISVQTIIYGSPINFVPDSIGNENTPPSGIIFTNDQFTLGTLGPLDIVPIWIKRTTNMGVTAIENDGFTIRVSGSPL
jgi:hypothetical protein